MSRSRDDGKTFKLQSIIPAPPGRDIRDPCFFVVGKRLFIKAITRLPGFALRDQDATGDTQADRALRNHGQTQRWPIGVRKLGDFPSAGDTSYAGVARLGGGRFLVGWYSSPLKGDPSWITGFAGPTNIWEATIDLAGVAAHDRL